MRAALTFFTIWLVACGPVRADEKPAVHPLVTATPGKLPIIISAPHGGSLPIPDVPERKGEGLARGSGKFVTSQDTGTEQLASAIADAIEAKMGKRPYLVAAKFHRKYADANRPAELGYEDAKAKPPYDAFHGAIAKYCGDVCKQFGRGLLLDVHGQAADADVIFRGTQNGKTVALLTQRFGPGAQTGPKSFFGLLDAAGLKSFPLDDSKERTGFTGGHIVVTYGGSSDTGLDAIQLEFGSDYRKKDKIKDTATKVAQAIDEFAKLYLLEKPQAKSK